MLFVSDAPIQIEALEDRKIIILTKNKIMFSHLDFVEQYLAMPLMNVQPTCFYYSKETMQTLVQSAKTIQIYKCDWKTQIQLVKVFIIHNSNIDNIYFDKKSGWNIVGSVCEYDTAKITFIQPIIINSIKKQDILGQCYVQNRHYILTADQLLKMQQQQAKYVQINWKDRMMILRNSNYQVNMQAAVSADKKRDIICINGQYTMIIKHKQVIAMVDVSGTIYIRNSLRINQINDKSSSISINVEKISYFSDLGTISAPRGKLYSSYLYDNQLALLYYSQKQIHIDLLPLMLENQGKKTQGHQQKKLFGSISRIMEDPHQDLSQYVSKINYSTYPAQDKKEPTASPSPVSNFYDAKSKPIIKDIECIEDQIQPDQGQLNRSDSQVISRSGLDFCVEADNQVENITKTKNSRLDKDFSLADSEQQKQQNQKSRKKEQSKIQNIVILKRMGSETARKKKLQKKLSKGSINSKSGKLDFGNLLSQQFADDAQTPGFGLVAGGGQNWASFDRRWQQQVDPQINQVQDERYQQQSIVFDEKQQILLKSMPGIPTKKIQFFKPKGVQITKAMVEQIQQTSYCRLIQKACETQPERFQQLVTEFMSYVLQQPQCSLLFADKIQTHNPQYTKDKIKRYFKGYLGKDIYIDKITAALQEFRLSEVPPQALKFPYQFIKILKIIYKDIYISELTNCSQSTIEVILDSYFMNKYTEDNHILIIQDQRIDIAHPRNMLNILLYLNQHLNLDVQSILRPYCKKLIEYEHIDILKKIVDEQIFQICQVNRSVLDNVIKQNYRQQILMNQTHNAWHLIQLLTVKLFDEYRLKTAIITQLNQYEIVYSLQSVLQIKNPSINIYTFLEDIIIQNSGKNLAKLKLQTIYRSLFWLQDGIKLKYLTNQLILLVKTLVQKFGEFDMFVHAFRLLQTIVMYIKKSFICFLLFKYADCKFINRFANQKQVSDLQSIIPQFFVGKQISIKKLSRDPIQNPDRSKCFSCSWTDFDSIYSKYLHTSFELKLLTFSDFNCAYQIFLCMNQTQKKNFQRFYVQIEKLLTIFVDDMNQNDQSINPKGKAQPINQQSLQKNDQQLNTIQKKLQVQSEVGSSLPQDQLLNLQLDANNNRKSNKIFKSMTLVNHYLDIRDSLQKVNSDKKGEPEIYKDNEDIQRLKWLVDRDQILEALQQIFNKYQSHVYMKSLQIIDLQKVGLHHIDAYKVLLNSHLQYPVSRVISFKIFTIKNRDEAFEQLRAKIKSQTNIKNFWIIYMIMQILLGMGKQTGKMFIQKIIKYYQSDGYAHLVREILETAQLRDDRQYLQEMYKIATEYNQHNIASVFV